MINKKIFWSGLGIYFLLRIFSFFFNPQTPLWNESWLNASLTAVILGLVIYWLITNNKYAWYLIAGEILLGGAGGFFSLFGISLRTLLLVFALLIYFIQVCRNKELKQKLLQNRTVSLAIALLFFAGLTASLVGFYHWHNTQLVISDLIPYLFLGYYFPLRDLLKNSNFKVFCLNLLAVAVIGNALFVLLTMFLYSSGLYILQNAYYHWYRDVALGKITVLPFSYYRLVLNEHLLMIPVLIYYLNQIINKINLKLNFYLVFCLLFILSVNLTRIYILALLIGMIVLFSRKYFKRWLLTSALTLFAFILIFTGLHLMTSRGASLGWELFGLRLQSIISPDIEDSSLSRMLLLPVILNKIQSHFIIGQGLGDTVSVYSPIFKAVITTPNYDWGYLEIFSELGAIGFMVWSFFLLILAKLLQKSKTEQWQYAALAALLITNLTAPALFHVLGIILIITLFAKNEADTTTADAF